MPGIAAVIDWIEMALELGEVRWRQAPTGQRMML